MISATLSENILWVEFSDPESRNSFSLRAAEELAATCAKHKGEFDALVFTAQGRVFCSGGNLTDYAGMTEADQGIEVNRTIAKVLEDLEKLPVITICLVGGDCFGGGIELISAFDRVLSAPHAFFGFWQRRIGLSYGWGGGKRIMRRLGLKRTRNLALTAEVLSANEALATGLIDGIHHTSRLKSSAIELIKRHRSMPQIPVTGLKTWTSKSEREIFEGLWWSEEHRAALESRKKKPGAR